jgi:TolA-binding protein
MKSPLIFLLRHTVLLVVALFILIGIIYRQEIFGIGETSGDAATVDEQPSAAAENGQQTGGSGGLEPGQVVAPSGATAPPDSPVNNQQTSSSMVISPPSAPVETESEPGQEQPGDGSSVAKQDQPEHRSTAEAIHENEAQPPNPATETAVEVAASPGDSDPETRAQILNNARQAYWEGDSASAETYYKALIERLPSDADAHGELGDLYFAKGDLAHAAVEYEDAARLFFAAGNKQEASKLIDVLRRFAPELAEGLQQELFHP